MKNIVIGLVLLIVMQLDTSCEDRSDKPTLQLKASKVFISIELPRNFAPLLRSIYYYENGTGKYVACKNEGYNTITLFHLDENGKNKTISFQKEGDNATGKISGFKILNDSLIFITTNKLSQFCIGNFSGDVIRTINTQDFIDEEKYPFLEEFQSVAYPLCDYKLSPENKILCAIRIVKYPRTFSELKKRALFFEYDLTNDSIFPVEIYYPEELKDEETDNFYRHEFYYCHNDYDYILGFLNSHYLYRIKGNKLIEKILVKSKFANKFASWSKIKSGFDKIKEGIESSNYLNLVYDKYRKIYYRFVHSASKKTTFCTYYQYFTCE